jgi:hypothetical protein
LALRDIGFIAPDYSFIGRPVFVALAILCASPDRSAVVKNVLIRCRFHRH